MVQNQHPKDYLGIRNDHVYPGLFFNIPGTGYCISGLRSGAITARVPVTIPAVSSI